MIRNLRIITLLLLAVSVAATVVVVNARRSDDTKQSNESADFGHLGRFQFTGTDGAPVTSDSLRGKVLVFACFFTCCTESCPALSGSLARLQGELDGVPDVRLLSLTVDPVTDTPPKLDEYAKAFGAKPDRWVFLTGPRAEVEAFIIGQLHLAVEENKGPQQSPGNKMLHSNKLVLIDQSGAIRGYFDGTDAVEVNKLRDEIRALSGR